MCGHGFKTLSLFAQRLSLGTLFCSATCYLGPRSRFEANEPSLILSNAPLVTSTRLRLQDRETHSTDALAGHPHRGCFGPLLVNCAVILIGGRRRALSKSLPGPAAFKTARHTVTFWVPSKRELNRPPTISPSSILLNESPCFVALAKRLLGQAIAVVTRLDRAGNTSTAANVGPLAIRHERYPCPFGDTFSCWYR